MTSGHRSSSREKNQHQHHESSWGQAGESTTVAIDSVRSLLTSGGRCQDQRGLRCWSKRTQRSNIFPVSMTMKLFSAVCFLHVTLSSWFRCLHCCFTVVSQLGRRGRVVGSPARSSRSLKAMVRKRLGSPVVYDGGVLIQSYFSELVFDG